MSTKKEMPHEKDEWKGYTLDELRYMRAYAAARIEINRDRLRTNFRNARHAGPKSIGGVVGRVLGALSYIDIAIMSFKVGSKVLKTVRRIRS